MVTFAQSQIMFHSAKNRKLVPVIRAPLILSVLLSPMGDRNLVMCIYASATIFYVKLILFHTSHLTVIDVGLLYCSFLIHSACCRHLVSCILPA